MLNGEWLPDLKWAMHLWIPENAGRNLTDRLLGQTKQTCL